MCTVAVALRAHPDAPLIVAANRDEALDRAATPPLRWEGFVAGRDEVGGGSWLGFSDSGLFVGLTNLWIPGFREPRPRSRGGVVTALLSAGSLEAAEQALRALPLPEHGPFNVICADRSGRGFVAASAHPLHLEPLAPGVHVVSNQLPGTPWQKTARVHADVEAVLSAPAERLPAALASRLSRVTGGGSPQESACVITDHNYGTVSSTILLAGGAREVLRFADGRPDRTPFTDYSGLLRRA